MRYTPRRARGRGAVCAPCTLRVRSVCSRSTLALVAVTRRSHATITRASPAVTHAHGGGSHGPAGDVDGRELATVARSGSCGRPRGRAPRRPLESPRRRAVHGECARLDGRRVRGVSLRPPPLDVSPLVRLSRSGHARPVRTSATSRDPTANHAPATRPPSTFATSTNRPASTLCHDVMRASSGAAPSRLLPPSLSRARRAGGPCVRVTERDPP